MTPQRAVILRNIGRQLRDLGLIEAFENKVGIIDKKNRRAWPIVESKWKLLENVARQLERLGLDGPKKRATSLADVMGEFRSVPDDTGPGSEPADLGPELGPTSGVDAPDDTAADGDPEPQDEAGAEAGAGARPLADRAP